MADADLIIRPVRPGDRDGVIALIDGVYREYGEQMCLDDADSDLRDLDARYSGKGGAFVVLTDESGVRGCHGGLPLDKAGCCTFRRLYLDPTLRGSSWGHALMQWAIDWARDGGFERVEFWSDTRFVRAHRFFAKFGFETNKQTREMFDTYEPYLEYFYWMNL